MTGKIISQNCKFTDLVVVSFDFYISGRRVCVCVCVCAYAHIIGLSFYWCGVVVSQRAGG